MFVKSFEKKTEKKFELLASHKLNRLLIQWKFIKTNLIRE